MPIRLLPPYHLRALLLLGMVACLLSNALHAALQRMDLAGEWEFSLSAGEPSFPQAPQVEGVLTDRIELPGTTETRGKGPVNEAAEPDGLTRVLRFNGAAWYSRTVEIPQSWAGKQLRFTMERTRYTQVWVDGKAAGSCSIYGTPQSYDLSSLLTPGQHRITLMVDNRPERFPIAKAHSHQISDEAPTNWNGVLGELCLEALDPIRITAVQAYPQVPNKAFHLVIELNNPTGGILEGTVHLSASSFNHPGKQQQPAPLNHAFKVSGHPARVEIDYALGQDALLWDEFQPALYQLKLEVSGAGYQDHRSLQLGLRDFRAQGSQFTINGRTTFLRGKQEAGVFPLTGYAPMDTAGWMEYLQKCRNYGINHIRCHTWIPPRAAFDAADRLGIYLQAELPFWGTFTESVRDALTPEALALLRECGNHPSFVMMTLANEAGGDRAIMNEMVASLRRKDPRRLYADGSNNYLWDPRLQPSNDFFISAKVINPATGKNAVPLRGSYTTSNGLEGFVQWGPAETRSDLSAAIKGLSMPAIGHETGQWTFYPHFDEIAKYTGVTRARNLERFRDIAARKGVLAQNADFAFASGVLSASLYREENEFFLRTAGIGGFQLLDLQDYPGQGSSYVGILDAFMDSKGLISSAAWVESCGPIVPLARFDRYTWRTGENYVAEVEIAHYGPSDLRDAKVTWVMHSETGRVVASGGLASGTIAQGALRKLGRIELPLAKLAAPAKYTLELKVKSGHEEYLNHYPVWVYPDYPETKIPANVSVVRGLDELALSLLAEGKRVVLIPASKNWADTLSGTYATDFWNWRMFNNTPGTMGLFIKAAHQALAHFPTALFSERQWTTLVQASTPVILTDAPAALQPIVQVIDNYERNDRLGLIFEAKVGAGSLLVCGIDLPSLGNDPAAEQLLASLLSYAASKDFKPSVSLSKNDCRRFLSPSLSLNTPVKASSFHQPPWGAVPSPERAVDGDICTKWAAKKDDPEPTLSIDLGARKKLGGLQLVWENDEHGYQYFVEMSADGVTWTLLSDQTKNESQSGRHYLSLSGLETRHVRVRLKAWPKNARASLRDIRLHP